MKRLNHGYSMICVKAMVVGAVTKPLHKRLKANSLSKYIWREILYVSAIDSEFTKDLDDLANNPNSHLDLSTASTATRERSTKFYGLLAGLFRGRVLHTLKSVPHADGYEAWRQLRLTLMSAIMGWPGLTTTLETWGCFRGGKKSIRDDPGWDEDCSPTSLLVGAAEDACEFAAEWWHELWRTSWMPSEAGQRPTTLGSSGGKCRCSPCGNRQGRVERW